MYGTKKDVRNFEWTQFRFVAKKIIDLSLSWVLVIAIKQKAPALIVVVVAVVVVAVVKVVVVVVVVVVKVWCRLSMFCSSIIIAGIEMPSLSSATIIVLGGSGVIDSG